MQTQFVSTVKTVGGMYHKYKKRDSKPWYVHASQISQAKRSRHRCQITKIGLSPARGTPACTPKRSVRPACCPFGGRLCTPSGPRLCVQQTQRTHHHHYHRIASRAQQHGTAQHSTSRNHLHASMHAVQGQAHQGTAIAGGKDSANKIKMIVHVSAFFGR